MTPLDQYAEKYVRIGLAPINTNVEDVPGVPYYDKESQYYDQSLATNGLDVSVEGSNKKPVPPPKPDDGGDDDQDDSPHVVEPDNSGFS